MGPNEEEINSYYDYLNYCDECEESPCQCDTEVEPDE